MTQNELNNKMSSLLKTYIKNKKYIETGNLIKSIEFTSDANLNFKLTANDYIQYLEDGNLLNNFFKQTSTINLIQSYLIDSINTQLDEAL